MNWFLEHANGTVVRVLAVVGAALVSALAILLMGWLARVLFGYDQSLVVDSTTTLIAVLLGGGAAASYLGKHTISRKETTDE